LWHAAQELREVKRRDKEYNDNLINKYYIDQRNIDAAASVASKDDVRRRERETKERQAEHDMVQNIFRVRTLLLHLEGPQWMTAACRVCYIEGGIDAVLLQAIQLLESTDHVSPQTSSTGG
jgi:hypothetical protein